MTTLNIVYKNKINGLKYVRFEVTENDNPNWINLFCCDDNSGEHDLHTTLEDIEKNYEEVERFEEEEEDEDGQ